MNGRSGQKTGRFGEADVRRATPGWAPIVMPASGSAFAVAAASNCLKYQDDASAFQRAIVKRE